MFLYEKEFKLTTRNDNHDLISYFSAAVQDHLNPDEIPVRFVVTQSDSKHHHCEFGVLSGFENNLESSQNSIFQFCKRKLENTNQFNAVFLVPTGIGAEIGGHAGDAAPVVRMLASSCDNLITHPNVVNASDCIRY